MQSRYGPKGLQIVGLTQADADDALAYAREFKLNYPVRAEAYDEFDRYGVAVLPTSKLIDPQGNVVVDSRRMGALSKRSAEIERVLREELG